MSTPINATVDSPFGEDASQTPTASGSSARKGKGAFKKSQDRFRNKKNRDFQNQLTSNIRKTLNLRQLPNLESVYLQVQSISARFRVSLIGSHIITKELWDYMKICGGRNFSNVDNPINRLQFQIAFAWMSFAKLVYAQRSFNYPVTFALSEIHSLTVDDLQSLHVTSSLVPVPLAMYLDALGCISVNNQHCVPVLRAGANVLKMDPLSVSSLVNRPCQELEKQALDLVFPGLLWIPLPDDLYDLSQQHRDLFQMRTMRSASAVFTAVCASVQHLKGVDGSGSFLTPVNISTGIGLTSQLVQFPSAQLTEEQPWCVSVQIDEYELRVAGAFRFGWSYQGSGSGCFQCNYEDCYQRGYVDTSAILRALIWSGYSPSS